jgi:hypothetical protein
VPEPFPGQYDTAWIARDEEDAWQGWIGYGGVGDRRYYSEKVYNAERAFNFRKVNIPADAEILEAKLMSTALSDIDDVVNTQISIQDSIATLPFPGSGVYANYTARPRLEATVEWNDISSWGNAWKDIQSPNFASLIQSLISLYGAIENGAITIFWGDRDGNTPEPPEGKANFIRFRGVGAMLRVDYEVVNVIEEPFPGIFYSFGDSQISDATFEVGEEEVINDARVIVPHHATELDYSYEPPIWVPIDFMVVEADTGSQQKYGRRTRINKEVVGNWFHFASTWCDQTIKDCKEPVPSMTLRILAADDDAISKLLAIRVIDKLLVTIDEAGIEHKFWIDDKVLTLETGRILATFKLREVTSAENIPGIFEVDVDRIDDAEEVLA